MSTKAQIQNEIDVKLASGSAITAVEHRDVANMVLNELFPSTTNVVLATGDLLKLYQIR
jgi:hypothetical protein